MTPGSRFFGLALLMLALPGAISGQANLIKNAGFENPPAKANLPGDGWWLYEGRGQSDAGVDKNVAHSGGASVRLQAGAEARFLLVSPPFEVSPGDELQFEAWARDTAPAGADGRGNFGLAFRDAAGRVFEHVYVPAETRRGDWTLISGTATAPAGAVRAEMHLGYANAPGTVWFDDVRVVISNPLSLSLATGAQPWTGPQTVTLRIVSRQTLPFHGVVRAAVSGGTSDVPVTVAPGAERLVDVPIMLGSVGMLDYTMSLLDAGNTVRTLKGKFRVNAPLTLFPACPCYLVADKGNGDVRVDARLAVDPARRRGMRFAATVVDSSGVQIDSAAAEVSGEEFVGVTLHVPVAKPAALTVLARLTDADGKELAAQRTEVRVRPAENTAVALGADGFLRIAGHPHFPIGLYSSGREEEMGRAGFSATHNYGITTGAANEPINPNEAHLQELLDRSWSHGLRMMVELPRKAIETAQWPQVRRRIETFRHHPGLLCWGSEERVARGEAPLANIAALYQLVRELDPEHPLVLGDTREVIGKLQTDRRNLFPDDCMDAGIWWWYPIPLHAPDGNGLDGREPGAGLLQPPSWLTTTQSRKPLWIAIQSYQQPRRDGRFPTPVEYRAMAYLSVIAGVKGLWFYTGSGQRDWQGKPAGLLNKPAEGHWDYVRQLVRELRELESVIVAPVTSEKISMDPADAPVEFTVRESGGVWHLLAANKSGVNRRVRFTGGGLTGRKVRVLHEEHAASIQGDALTDDFGPYGVHVYRLE